MIHPGDILKIDTRELAEDAASVTFDRVLLVGGEGDAKIGTPYLEGASVTPDRLGPGANDMTRLAGSDPAVWLDLLDHASPALVQALRDLAAELEEISDQVEGGDLDALEVLMRRSRAWRAGR